MNRVIIQLINLYKIFFSNIFGRYVSGCKFYPSCSEYSKEAFEKHSFLKAFIMTIWRIARCNPLTRGGYDPIENQKSMPAGGKN